MSPTTWRVGGMRLVFLVPFLVTVVACPSPENAEQTEAGDSRTQRERYEALGESGLPGAQGVRGALDISDDIRARDALQDSILPDR